MRLCRLTPYGLTELSRIVRETGTLPPADELTEHWTEPHPSELSVAQFASAVAEWRQPTQIDDARHAQAAHETLRLPRRVASDRMIWPWLAIVAARDYTLARWQTGEKLNKDRVEAGIDKNAIGRLWWSAEIARVDQPRAVCTAVGMPPTDDPYVFVGELFRNADLHQNLTYTRELTDRTKLVAILAYVHHHPLSTAKLRDLLRDVGLLFSTVLLDAHETNLPTTGYPVDPEACAEALALLERVLKSESGSDALEAPTKAVDAQPAGSRSLLGRLLRRRSHKGRG